QASQQWALDDSNVRALVRLGEKVAAEYGGAPQDIEWALLDGQISLLQSRPITSLFPLPPGLPADPPALLFSFGAVQGMQDPMTTLGQDAFRVVSAGFARIWGFDYQPGEVPALHFAAERMWIRFDPLLRNRASRRMWMAIFPLIEAGAREQFVALLNDPRHVPEREIPQPETLARLAPVLARIVRRLVATLRHPEAMRTEMLGRVEHELALMSQAAAQAQSLNERVIFVRTSLMEIFPLFLDLVPTLAAGMAGFYRLKALAERAGVPSARVLEIMRGLPHNVTTEMDLALWEVARLMRSDAASCDLVLGGDGPALADQWRARTLPPVAQGLLDQFLARYGVRGVGEIDMGRTRWREDPTQVLQMVQNYLQIDEPTQAPDVVFQRGATAAEAALDEVVATIAQRLGPAQARVARFLGSRARALAGVRETPKFTVIRIMGILRGVLDEGYRQLAAQGVLDAAADGVFLTLRELEAVAAGYAIDWKALVRERKATYAREMRRRQVPRLLLGDGRAFYGGVAGAAGLDAAGALHGTPVSP
ncbi:MAG: PEP/pyruvate-binding domain-containing protein, partial [Caldilineaceae bacterium]